jgi:hypothetical protein
MGTSYFNKYGMGTGYFAKKQEMKYDRDGDIIMTRSKVNLKETKKQGLCFNYGKKGHRVKNCRQKQKQKAKMFRKSSEDDAKVRTIKTEIKTDHPRRDATVGSPEESPAMPPKLGRSSPVQLGKFRLQIFKDSNSSSKRPCRFYDDFARLSNARLKFVNQWNDKITPTR